MPCACKSLQQKHEWRRQESPDEESLFICQNFKKLVDLSVLVPD